jgi:hypothetical protein
MISRSFDAARFNEIVNHPAIYPWVRGHHKGPLDLTSAINDQRNVLLLGEHGGILFTELQPTIWECHTQVLPEGRGKWAVDMTEACLHWMFTRTLAMEIMTKVPKGNYAARALAKAIGGHHEFTARQGWIMDDKPVPADIFVLRIHDWMLRAPGLPERGQWFHERLEREFARLGAEDLAHEDDAEHDRFVGAACDMILGKQVRKGVLLYNRWAMMAGYQPATIMSMNPVAIDIGTALVVVRNNGDFYVAGVNRQDTDGEDVTCRSAG